MALNDIGKAAIADAKQRIAKYERKIKLKYESNSNRPSGHRSRV